jgi:hypothetical protein
MLSTAAISVPWLDVAQTAGIVIAVLLGSLALFLDYRMRRVGNLIHLTEQHRELWERMFKDAKLSRILDPDANLAIEPVTAEEEQFVILIILHLSNSYYAISAGFFRKPDGLRKDIELFFALPVPREVWLRIKDLQDRQFVDFVESCYPSPDESKHATA